MKFLHKALTACFLLISSSLMAQNVTLSGYVTDIEDGESMIGVNVFIEELKQGVGTNVYGFYSITIPPGEYTVKYSFIGYDNDVSTIDLSESVRKNVELKTNSLTTEVVEVTAERKDKNVQQATMGVQEIKVANIKKLPVLFGEVDVIKTLQLLPGVQSSSEGNSGFYVRGGGPDQNLLLLDDAVVYNNGHLFGFLSVFNGAAIKDVQLIKGGMPAEYGGRLSSVVNVTMKEGNMKKYQAEGNIGLITSSLTLQGPIKKDKASFILSGRRSYLDILARPLLEGTENEGNNYYMYDINGKVNWKISDKDRIYLSGYFGRDKFSFAPAVGDFSAEIPWGNSTATLRWNHLFNDRLFVNSMLIFNDYQFSSAFSFLDFRFKINSGVRDIGAKTDFDYYVSPKHHLKLGASVVRHQFTPENISGAIGETEIDGTQLDKIAYEYGLYAQDDYEVNDRLKLNYGLRLSAFSLVGPYEKDIFNDQGEKTGSRNIDRWRPVKTYYGVEPRISMRLKTGKASSFKSAITVNQQYVHMVSQSNITLPTDLWVPSTDKVRPQLGIQYAVGYFQNFKENMFETSVELYYKDMYNQADYGESVTGGIGGDIEDDFVFGRGYSTGAEFFFKKALGDLTGWVGYTLAWTWRRFPDINEGRAFPVKYDRRHDLSAVLSYKASEKWDVSAVFVYGTGLTTTMPESFYNIDNRTVIKYADRNSYRLPPYHRLDFSATYNMGSKRKNFEHSLVLSVYNVYNRQNPFFVYLEDEGSIEGGDLQFQGKQVSIFPVLPSISWNFKISK